MARRIRINRLFTYAGIAQYALKTLNHTMISRPVIV